MLIFWTKCPKNKSSLKHISPSTTPKYPSNTELKQTKPLDHSQNNSQSETCSSSGHTSSQNNSLNMNSLTEQFNLKLKHLLLNPLNPSISKNHEIIMSLIEMYQTQPEILNCIISFILLNFVQVLTMNNDNVYVILKIYEIFSTDTTNINVVNNFLSQHLVFLLSFKKGCELLTKLIRKGNLTIINETMYSVDKHFIYCVNTSYSANVIEELLNLNYQPIIGVLVKKIIECLKDILLTEYGRKLILKVIQLTNTATKEMLYLKLKEFSLVDNNYCNM
jgi:hypothetical protein